MAWKPEVKVVNEAKWHQNGLVFATEKEAHDNAHDLMMRWFAVEEYRAVWVEDAVVNYDYTTRQLKAVEKGVQ